MVTDQQCGWSQQSALRHTEPLVTGNVDLLGELWDERWVNPPADSPEDPGGEGFEATCSWLHDHLAFHFEHQDVSAIGGKSGFARSERRRIRDPGRH